MTTTFQPTTPGMAASGDLATLAMLAGRVCASCGAREDLRALDDEGFVWFCADCYAAGDVHCIDESLLELGCPD